MNRFAIIGLGIFLLAGAQSLSAQQINPRIPPAPPPAEAPASSQPVATTPTATAPSNAPSQSSSQQHSQQIDPTVPPLPPSADAESDTSAAPSGPVFDPLHAQRSLNVGTFYFNKGSYDAAIVRFIEASNYQPTLAMPWKLLGEAYEKKHEDAKALEAYNKYLDISPKAPDTSKIRKIISELEEKVAQDSLKKE